MQRLISCVPRYIIIIDPQRTCAERGNYGSRSMCVCVSVCYQANCHILGLYIEKKVLLGFSWPFQHTHCVDFVENALFWQHLLTTIAFFAS
jgi:hypothetical protein